MPRRNDGTRYRVPGNILGTKEGEVNIRLGSRHGKDFTPKEALEFAARIVAKANEMMPIWESRNGIPCPHGRDPVACGPCTIEEVKHG
jgi:hypothetical protein